MNPDPRNAGDALPRVTRTITSDGINAYRVASGDNNPIHYDDEFAAATQFGGVIAHGMLTLALVAEMMAAAYGADWLQSGSLKVRFRGAAYPGDRLETVGSVTDATTNRDGIAVKCGVAVVNADTRAQIITGSATVSIPSQTGNGVPQQ